MVVDLVVGGMHLSAASTATVQRVGSGLSEPGVTHVSPCHCTGADAEALLAKAFGLYKVENVAAIVVALLIFLAGYEIAREAWQSTAQVLTTSPVIFVGVALTVLIPLAFSRYEGRLSRLTNSPSLAGDSRHFQTDALSSAVVLIALVGSRLGWPLDRIGAAVVVIFVVSAGWELLSDGMRVLLDASLDAETMNKVRGIFSSGTGGSGSEVPYWP